MPTREDRHRQIVDRSIAHEKTGGWVRPVVNSGFCISALFNILAVGFYIAAMRGGGYAAIGCGAIAWLFAFLLLVCAVPLFALTIAKRHKLRGKQRVMGAIPIMVLLAEFVVACFLSSF